ncbi:MAG: hypothetical protein AAGA60_10495 [Cyanobacteria bacterium P01_E01_bin.42]
MRIRWDKVAIVRALTQLDGEFSLILVRCNFCSVRSRVLQGLQKHCAANLHEVRLARSQQALYMTISQDITGTTPDEVLVLGSGSRSPSSILKNPQRISTIEK